MLGKRFAHYEVIEKLASGGMGDVYRARDLSLGRDVAVKFLPARFAGDAERLARFEQEARAASSLNHPNIVTIHELGEADGVPWIVMELVRGRTLRTLLTGRPLPARRVLEIGAQVADGLARAHAAGIVHRDLKPENLMLSDDGYLKILDFGLAKLRAPKSDGLAPAASAEADTQSLVFGRLDRHASPDTARGVILGTAAYMSPEQARGHAVDFRSDQFALGSMLYEMAAGKPPFERPTAVQTLAAIIEDAPEPLGTRNPAAPPPLRWIVDRCLAKEPEHRYASTLDLAHELRDVLGRLEEMAVAAPPQPPSSSPTLVAVPPPPARPRTSRAVAVAGLSVAVAAAVAIGLARPHLAGWLGREPIPRARQVAVLSFASDAGSQAFAAGLAETLTSKLTQLEQFHGSLFVVPASEVRGAAVTSAAAARSAFGVNLVVTGSLQRQGERIRLTANLVDAATLRQLRAASLDARADDLATWQDGAVERIARMLELELSPRAREVVQAGDTRVAEAWELYVEGRGELQRYESAEHLDRGLALFQRALERDPGYALAYAGIGEAHWRRYQLTKQLESVELAQKACLRAVALNDLLAPVHVTLGVIHDGTGRAADAVEDFRRALALDPASVEALLGLADADEALGRKDEAEAAHRKALALRPDYWAVHNTAGAFYFAQRRYPEAEAAFQRVVALTPDNPRGYSNLGGLYWAMGRYDDAQVMLERSVARKPTSEALSNLGTLEFFRGRYGEAAATFEKAVALADADFRIWYNLAAARYWAPGQRDQARPAYERAAAIAERNLRVNPKDAALLVRLADCEAALGKKDRARTRAAEAARLAPADADVLFRAGEIDERLGRRDEAVALIGRALAAGFPPDELARWPGLDAVRADPRLKLSQRRTTP